MYGPDKLTPSALTNSFERSPGIEAGSASSPIGELVEAAQVGDARAINDLFVRYSESLRRIIRARLGSRIRQAAMVDSMDVLQETLGSAHANFGSFTYRGEGSLIAWLARIAEHTIHDQNRYISAAKRGEGGPVRICDLLASGVFDAESSAPTPEALAEAEEQRARIDQCVHALKPAYREVILLRCYAGADWRTIAEQLGVATEGAAQSTFGRAAAALEFSLRKMDPAS